MRKCLDTEEKLVDCFDFKGQELEKTVNCFENSTKEQLIFEETQIDYDKCFLKLNYNTSLK
jgi:hypothetical protein